MSTMSYPVPQDESLRRQLMQAARRFVARVGLTAPASLEQLSAAAGSVLEELGLSSEYRPYVGVLVSNELWRDVVAHVPPDRRLLLLPQCLRDAQCPAQVDELGLACRMCGRCTIGRLKERAQGMGTTVLVAEGSPMVMSLIQSGRIQAVIGVSCMDALERVFPYMHAAAVPGVAVPLLGDGCCDTAVDEDWVMHLLGASPTQPPSSESSTKEHKYKGIFMQADALQQAVGQCFLPEQLGPIMGLDPAARNGQAMSETETIALEWLARSGKRWRPFLAACAAKALSGDDSSLVSDDLAKVLVAVECFHKASLVHDDIEDHDQLRYGQKTLHEQYGVATALNVGDWLLGQGYRLIAMCAAPDAAKTQMLAAASNGHCALCRGQGFELSWARQPRPLSVSEVLEIFEHKTSPAFEVALSLGALHAGADGKVLRVLKVYSRALGIAYQVADDLEDFGTSEGGDAQAQRPSILMALASERAKGQAREMLQSVWRQQRRPDVAQLSDVLQQLGAIDKARELLAEQVDAANSCLDGLTSSPLKVLLRRVILRMFDSSATLGCCRDVRADLGLNADLGAAVTAPLPRALDGA